jgi:two-component system, OmpR family, response regulator
MGRKGTPARQGFSYNKQGGCQVPTICIVDDNTDITQILSVFFRKLGCDVVCAADGRECIRILQSRTPDLILLDVMMEPMDGWQTLIHLKDHPRTRRIPVVMLSGKSPSPEELRVFGEYFEKYLMKPISFAVLKKTVTEVLAKQAPVRDI